MHLMPGIVILLDQVVLFLTYINQILHILKFFRHKPEFINEDSN